MCDVSVREARARVSGLLLCDGVGRRHLISLVALGPSRRTARFSDQSIILTHGSGVWLRSINSTASEISTAQQSNNVQLNAYSIVLLIIMVRARFSRAASAGAPRAFARTQQERAFPPTNVYVQDATCAQNVYAQDATCAQTNSNHLHRHSHLSRGRRGLSSIECSSPSRRSPRRPPAMVGAPLASYSHLSSAIAAIVSSAIAAVVHRPSRPSLIGHRGHLSSAIAANNHRPSRPSFVGHRDHHQ